MQRIHVIRLINKRIIIPPGFSKQSRGRHPHAPPIRFFDPRLIVVRLGQEVEFKNDDENSHIIESVDLEEKADNFFDTGQIGTGQSITIRLNNLKQMIPYRCKIHPEERGVILMTEKETRDLTKTERLRLLTQVKGSENEFWNIIKETGIDTDT